MIWSEGRNSLVSSCSVHPRTPTTLSKKPKIQASSSVTQTQSDSRKELYCANSATGMPLELHLVALSLSASTQSGPLPRKVLSASTYETFRNDQFSALEPNNRHIHLSCEKNQLPTSISRTHFTAKPVSRRRRICSQLKIARAGEKVLMQPSSCPRLDFPANSLVASSG